MSYIIAGIHTGIGKTMVSALLCRALEWAYWKPVQAGDLEATDAHFVNHFSPRTTIFPETYRLKIPASPHYAAEAEGIQIDLENFRMPQAEKLIIETAGGIMTPLSDTACNIDLIARLNKPVILVSQNYLGSINHTLLTAAALQASEIAVKGIVFNGPENVASEAYILRHTGMHHLFSVPRFNDSTGSEPTLFADGMAPYLKSIL